MQDHSQDHFKRELGLLDGTMLVVGSMIGSGIFIVSSDMVRQVGSAGWLIAIWVVTALLTIVAAVSYGELSAMFPKAGGQYVYIKEAYGKLIGFLYGWSFFAVIQTGTIAAVGVAFSKFAAYIFPSFSDENIIWNWGDFVVNAAQIVSIITIILLTYINSRGVKNSKIMQTVLTVIKISSLLGLIVFGFILAAKADIWNANWTNAWGSKTLDTETGSWLPISGAAVVGDLLDAADDTDGLGLGHGYGVVAAGDHALDHHVRGLHQQLPRLALEGPGRRRSARRGRTRPACRRRAGPGSGPSSAAARRERNQGCFRVPLEGCAHGDSGRSAGPRGNRRGNGPAPGGPGRRRASN